jgi:hypothetical protein
MRRLASALAAVLSIAAASSARAEPLDLDLHRMGPPDPAVWASVSSATPAEAAVLAREARQRFAILSTDLALALSSSVLQPASTTGHSGFAVDLEAATVAVHPRAVGSPPPAGFSNVPWVTRAAPPDQLYLPSVHVRKGLPFSFELGGRVIYLAQSPYFAAQGEAKWALNEGFEHFPDLAVRAAYTRLFGQRDLTLGATDLDLMISKRWSLKGVMSFTPYLVGRLTRVSASSDRMDFATAAPASPVDTSTQAAFPNFGTWLYRTTLGLRFTTYAVSLSAEATYFAGATPSADGYEGVKLASSIGGAAQFGFEF